MEGGFFNPNSPLKLEPYFDILSAPFAAILIVVYGAKNVAMALQICNSEKTATRKIN